MIQFTVIKPGGIWGDLLPGQGGYIPSRMHSSSQRPISAAFPLSFFYRDIPVLPALWNDVPKIEMQRETRVHRHG
jgi:hypothetical protein